MANEDDKKATQADKGKGKAVDETPKEVKKDKDGNPIKEDEKLLPAGQYCRRAVPPPHASDVLTWPQRS